jgi:CBS domain-containing protein
VDQTIEELNVGLETVVRVTIGTKVIEAFKDIAHWNINGIAVLGEGGVLVGNISSSDLRIIVENGSLDMTSLFLTAEDFIRLVRQKSITRLGTIVSVREYDTIGNLLRIFASNRVQRVFVVDRNGKLTGVITLRDLLLKLVPPHVPPRGNTSPRPSERDDDI